MIFIVGGKGLTGSAIVNFLKSTNQEFRIIQKENAEYFINKECDTLIYANGNAIKYKAMEDPFFDFEASLRTISFYIHKIKYKRFIFLSTVDIYSSLNSEEKTNEDANIDIQKLSAYGFHKYLAEQYVKKFADNYLIFRLPALVGNGLQKNPIYDFLHSHKKMFISKESFLNVINTDFIASSIFNIISKDIENETFNLCSKNSIKIDSIKDLVGFNSDYNENVENIIQNYHINTNKIQKYLSLTSSEEAIMSYYLSIKDNR